MTPTLRVLAMSAPHWPARPPDTTVRSLTAGTPFSLQNALRQAAGVARSGYPGGWGDSNWTSQEMRQESVLLLEFMEEATPVILDRVRNLKPNLVLIGAMTLGIPGAVRCATLVREELGGDCLIVLGGKHANETLRRVRSEAVMLDVCPANLMKRGDIPESASGIPLFDVILSGEAEEAVTVLGELVHHSVKRGESPRAVLSTLPLLGRARGDWIAAAVCPGGVELIASPQVDLDFTAIPTAPAVFGLQSAFPVFEGLLTGHAYSDMGRGCRFNCFFCSERAGLEIFRRKSLGEAVGRLYQHFEDIWQQGDAGHGEVAAFVEDSILLSGDEDMIWELIRQMERRPLEGLRWGCQLTVADIERLSATGALAGLQRVGLEYVAFGMETINEEVASRMSKRRAARRGLWTEANRRALRCLSDLGLKAGMFVLWGLGETQFERVSQLEQLYEWSGSYTLEPNSIGLNWATLHPSGRLDRHETHLTWPALPSSLGTPVAKRLPSFLEWGTEEDSKRLPIFVELFGEASERYPFYDGEIVAYNDLHKIHSVYTARFLPQATAGERG